jgi:acetate---CoA ligase (ADP-forming)
MQHVGISALASTGNEAVLSVSELIDYFIEEISDEVTLPKFKPVG